MPVVRHITKMIFSGRKWWGTPVIIIGSVQTASKVYESLTMNPFGGYVPVACFIENEYNPQDYNIKNIPVYNIDSLFRFNSFDLVHHVIIIRDSLSEHIKNTYIEYCINNFKDTIIINSIHGISSFWLLFNTQGDYYGSTFRTNLLDKRIVIYKRIIDLFFGTILGLISLPILIVSSLLLLITGTRKIIYSQIRMGLNGKELNSTNYAL